MRLSLPTALGIEFNAVNIVFTGTGLLAITDGIYARIHLRDAIASNAESASEPAYQR